MKILYFAHVKHLIGKSEDYFEFHHPVTVKELKAHLLQTYPKLSGESYQVAVNESFAVEDTEVHNHDVVAIIPPVSGG